MCSDLRLAVPRAGAARIWCRRIVWPCLQDIAEPGQEQARMGCLVAESQLLGWRQCHSNPWSVQYARSSLFVSNARSHARSDIPRVALKPRPLHFAIARDLLRHQARRLLRYWLPSLRLCGRSEAGQERRVDIDVVMIRIQLLLLADGLRRY